MKLDIAPLQDIYSEALPAQPRLKRKVFREVLNAGEEFLGRRRSSRGSPFQILGPTTEKARCCIVEVRANGTLRSPRAAERRGCCLCLCCCEEARCLKAN